MRAQSPSLPGTDAAALAVAAGTASEVAVLPVAAAPAPAPSAPPISFALDRLARAWGVAGELGERAARVRIEADELGIASVDPLARAVLYDHAASAPPRARAEAAVRMAPRLPAAHAALARAAWDAGDFRAAVPAAWNAVRTLPAHFDAWLWLGATASVLAMLALASGALLFLGARAFATGRFLAHDVGDLVEPSMPAFARVAAVAALAGIPAALGEGWAGVALGLFAIALFAGSREQRAAVVAAALCFGAAVHPIAQIAGSRVAAVASDAIAAASWAAESGIVDAVDAARLARAADADADGRDPLALQALAQWARRSGDLRAADARYTALLEGAGPDPVVLNNAASVKLALGEPAAAIDLYRRAIAVEASALLWFNLSQAHGAAIDVEQHDRALAAAQSLDPRVVSDLTERLAAARTPYAAELALSQDRVRDRVLAGDARTAAAELRRRIAPGRIGRSPWAALAVFGGAALLALALARRFEASSACPDCGAHQCRRCGATPRGDGRCEPCQRRRFQGRA
ncbi:MAG: hypothetical protein DCC71_19980, partial [Proteobacteria bacterium]